ncbi:hypothetical protein AC1031_015300 [Aphanomyces cochlioides]|nr:hypothetical protein AC1031_015300 [Aphanomyces cochlioides]
MLVTLGHASIDDQIDLASRDAWNQAFPHVPRHVHDIWIDLVVRKGMQQWSLFQEEDHDAYFLVGHISKRAMSDGKLVLHAAALDYEDPIVVFCKRETSSIDMRDIGRIRSALFATDAPSIRHIYVALAAQSPQSISYYAAQDSLVV